MQCRAEVRRWRSARGGDTGRRRHGRGHSSAIEACGRLNRSLVVEEKGALMDKRLDDGLIGASGRKSVHGGEVRSHKRGPEADGQVLAGHQIDSVPLANPVRNKLIEKYSSKIKPFRLA